MAGKKFSLLKSSFNQDAKKDEQYENPSNPKENRMLEKNSKYSNAISKAETNDYPILDKAVISFVASHFPEVSKDIIYSLNNLKDTIEKSIDYIEDISSEIIKKDRNFDLSKKYRENTMNLHEISISIEDYISWMGTQSPLPEKSSKEDSKKDLTLTSKDAETLDSSSIKELNICEDFTDKEPKAFKLDNFTIDVEDWNDLIMKTADLLIKDYKKSKNLYYSDIKAPTLSSKKSIQNEFRDTVIEILLEYRIEPSKYFVLLN